MADNKTIEDYGDIIQAGRRKGYDRFSKVDTNKGTYQTVVFNGGPILNPVKKILPVSRVPNASGFYEGYLKSTLDSVKERGIGELAGPAKKLINNKWTISKDADKIVASLNKVVLTCGTSSFKKWGFEAKEENLMEALTHFNEMDNRQDLEDVIRLFYMSTQLNSRAYALSGTLALSDPDGELYAEGLAVKDDADIKKITAERDRIIGELRATVDEMTTKTAKLLEDGGAAEITRALSFHCGN